MLNIVSDNPFDIFTDRVLKFKSIGQDSYYFTIRKNSMLTITSYENQVINLFNMNELEIGDKFQITIPKNENKHEDIRWCFNLPINDIFKRTYCNNFLQDQEIFIDIVSSQDSDFKYIIFNHQYPNIVRKIQ